VVLPGSRSVQRRGHGAALRLALLVCGLMGLGASTAQAQWQIKPFLGVTFGGGTTFNDLEQAVGKPKLALGVSGAWLGNVIGVEGEIARVPGFFQAGEQSLVVSSSVMTLTGNIVVTLPRHVMEYGLRPYLTAGGGMVRVRSEDVLSFLPTRRRLPVSDFGGGVTGFVTKRVGVSWDVRYFRTFGGKLEGASIGKERLSFWRVYMAAAIRLGKVGP
jgi:hypothetical protein